MEYIIITPAKNESKYIDNSIQSVLSQTVAPKKWIIVDDGSTDDTATIVGKYAKTCEYIELITHKSTNEKRAGGSKIVRAFYVGYDTIRGESFDIIVKLDADLTLPPNYFEEIIKCFERNSKIGLCGGYCTVEENGMYVKECYTKDNVRGPIKAYRRICFDDIGGIKEIWNWDSIDEAAMRYRGWKSKVLPLAVIHHRPTSKEYNLLKHSFKTGREMYKERIDVISLLVISFVNAFRKPVVIGGMLYICGYIVSWIKRENRTIEKELGDFIRNERYNMLLKKLGW